MPRRETWSRGGNFGLSTRGRGSTVGETQIVAKSTLRAFWDEPPRARHPLEAWYRIVDRSIWTTPADVKATFGTTVDFIADNRLIFDIGGNKYRLGVHVAYRFGKVLIKFVGTHRQYDDIDPETV